MWKTPVMILGAWEPSDTIAVTSVIVTGIVALFAVGGQLYVSWRQRREDRRRQRYEELAAAYRETGEAIDRLAETVGMASVGMETEISVGTRQKFALLQLHGAALNVLRSFNEVIKAINAMDARTSKGNLSTDEERRRFERDPRALLRGVQQALAGGLAPPRPLGSSQTGGDVSGGSDLRSAGRGIDDPPKAAPCCRRRRDRGDDPRHSPPRTLAEVVRRQHFRQSPRQPSSFLG